MVGQQNTYFLGITFKKIVLSYYQTELVWKAFVPSMTE